MKVIDIMQKVANKEIFKFRIDDEEEMYIDYIETDNKRK